jgi:hypothetical protein
MSKSRHHHSLPRGSLDVEQRQQEQPLLVDAPVSCSVGTGNTCLNVDDDELKMVTTIDGCLERTGSLAVVDGMQASSSTPCGVNPQSGNVRRPSIRGVGQPTSSTAWKLKYQDFMPSAQHNAGLWDKSESFQ